MTPARGREMINVVRKAFCVSIRRSCRAIPAGRGTYHYRFRRPEQAPLRKRIREIAQTRMRYGYRRITVVLRRQGWHVNVKRVDIARAQ
jgi:putative transposase